MGDLVLYSMLPLTRRQMRPARLRGGLYRRCFTWLSLWTSRIVMLHGRVRWADQPCTWMATIREGQRHSHFRLADHWPRERSLRIRLLGQPRIPLMHQPLAMQAI